MSAPGSLASRRLMIDAYPIFLMSATAAGVIAPAHATVLSNFARFVIPGTDSFLTWDWAAATATPIATIAKIEISVLMLRLQSVKVFLKRRLVYNQPQLWET